MEPAWKAVAAVARFAVWVGAALLFAAAFIVSAEVFARKGLGPLLGPDVVFTGSDEISAYLFAVGTSLSLTHALVTRSHVRIDALYACFGPRMRTLLDLLALIVLAVFTAALLERAWHLASTSYVNEIRSNTPLRIPLAWAQIPWLAGIGLFALALVLAILRTLSALLRRDYASAAGTASAVTQSEEVESELEGLGLGGRGSGARP